MIELKETFCTTMVLEDIIIPNTWNITVNLIPNQAKQKYFNKAMERLQYYIAELLDNSIFVSNHNIQNIADLPLKAQVHIFPDDPWDHLIAMCLYTKFSSILEEVFYVDNISINSHQARSVSHSFSEEDGGTGNLLDLFDQDDEVEATKYWYKPTPQLFLLHEGLKLVDATWDEVDLSFEEKSSGTVITLDDFKKPKPPESDNDDTPG